MTAVSSGPDISHGGVSGSEIWDNLFATMAYRSPGSAATSDRALERRRAASAVNNRIWEAWRWSGLVVFFLTPQWRRLRNIEIAWRLLRWWPRIDDQVRIMARQQRLSCRSATAPAGWGCFADSRLARYRLLPSGPCPPDIGVVGEYIVAIGARRPRRAGTSLRSRGADRDPGRYRLARPLPVTDALSRAHRAPADRSGGKLIVEKRHLLGRPQRRSIPTPTRRSIARPWARIYRYFDAAKFPL